MGIGQLVEHLTEKLGSSTRCGKEFSPRVNFQCRLPYGVQFFFSNLKENSPGHLPEVNSLQYFLQVQLRASTPVRMIKSPSTGSHTTGHRNTAEISSAALAAAVPYPVKAIQISH